MQQQKLEFVPLDPDNTSHTECMYKVRTHPEVVCCLKGSPPKNFEQHLHYLRTVKNKQFFILKENGHPCGYAQAGRSETSIELGWAIDPLFWGKGIGSFGVEKLIEETLPQGRPLRLIVLKTNTRALHLYLKKEFRILNETPDGLYWEMEYCDAPKISVVLSTYNRHYKNQGMETTYLERAVRSILAQSFGNFELILINDGSPDASHDACARFAAQDPRIRYIHHETNSGLPALRYNEGIALSQAPLLAFMFDDDEWFPNALDALHTFYIKSKQKQASLAMVYGQVEFYDERENKLLSTRFGEPWSLKKLQNENFLANCSVLIEKQAIDLVGGYDEHPDMRRICDWDLWQRIGIHFNVKRMTETVGRVNIRVRGSLELTLSLDHKKVKLRQCTRTVLPLQTRPPTLREQTRALKRSMYISLVSKLPKLPKIPIPKPMLRSRLVSLTKRLGWYKQLKKIYRAFIPVNLRPYENWESGTIAQSIHNFWISNPEEREHRENIGKLMQHLYNPGDTLLEAGCGSGLVYKTLVPQVIPNHAYHGIDITRKMIEIAKREHPEGNFTQGDLFQLSFPENSFSIASAFEVFCHLESIEKPLQELFRVASRLVVFTVWVGKERRLMYETHQDKKFLHHIYTHEEIKNLIHHVLGDHVSFDTKPLHNGTCAYLIFK